MANTVYGDYSRGEIDHSTAGASYLYQREPTPSKEVADQIMAFEMMELTIASHHSGLIDVITTDGENNYARRMEKTIPFDEIVQRIGKQILDEVEVLIPSAVSDLGMMIRRI